MLLAPLSRIYRIKEMAVYQASNEVMQRSLTMTHAMINIGLGYVPMPIMSPEHYLELMEKYNEDMKTLQAEAKASNAPKKVNQLELVDDEPEDAEIVAPQSPPQAAKTPSNPIPPKRKRKTLKNESTSTDTDHGSN